MNRSVFRRFAFATIVVVAAAVLSVTALVNARTANASSYGIQEFPLPAGCSLTSNLFTAGLNGMPVFSQNDCNSIGTINSAGQITEYPLPTHSPTTCAEGGSYDSDCPGFFAIGSDGNLWTPARGVSNAGPGFSNIDRIAPDGTITEFPVPAPLFALGNTIDPVPGPDGDVWFKVRGSSFATPSPGNQIGRLDPRTGAVDEFPIPTGPNTRVLGPWTGADGNVWFTEVGTNKVGRVSPTGDIVDFPVPTAGVVPFWMVLGPDGNMWFNEANGSSIGRVTHDGTITEFPLPPGGFHAEFAFTTNPGSIVGPDHNIWFSDTGTGKIGRIDMNGNVVEYAVPDTSPSAPVFGPDGTMWFEGDNSIDNMTTSGAVTEYMVPTPNYGPDVNVPPFVGSDGHVWFYEYNAHQIGRLTYYGSRFHGFLPPIDNQGLGNFKLGSTVPVKFQLLDGTTPITDAVVHLVIKQADGTPNPGVDEPASTAAATTGDLFRYDPSSQQYIFNLSTKAGYVNPSGATVAFTPGTWTITAVLDDGSYRSANIQLIGK